MVVDSALKTQGRVIYALMMREVHTIYGSSRLGYLWALINTMWGIFVFWLCRYLMGAGDPHGMSSLTFLLMGLGLYHIFSGIINKCMTAVSGNKALLTFPQVTPIDIMIARSIIVFATEFVGAVIAIMFGYIFGISFYLNNFGGLLFVIIITVMLGFSFGISLASLAVLFPTIEKIVPMVLRILMFASAPFYSATVIPTYALQYLWYNPLIQLVEYGRVSLSSGYSPPEPYFLYLVNLTFIMLSLGLLVERYVRRRLI